MEPALPIHLLQEMHAGVLQHLEELSAITRPIFRDVEFQRNKRRSATAGAAVSRTWYLAVDTWIAGTLATEEGIAHNPFEDDEVSDSVWWLQCVLQACSWEWQCMLNPTTCQHAHVCKGIAVTASSCCKRVAIRMQSFHRAPCC